MNFRYQKLAGRLMPIVPIKLKGKEWVSYDAYVDSGAGYSIFHSDVADDLEIKLEDGEKVYIMELGLRFLPAAQGFGRRADYYRGKQKIRVFRLPRLPRKEE